MAHANYVCLTFLLLCRFCIVHNRSITFRAKVCAMPRDLSFGGMMRLSRTLVSALRALSTIPGLKSDALQQFSKDHDELCPIPAANYAGGPVWRFCKNSEPPPFFRLLIERLRSGVGLVEFENYAAVELADIELVVLKQTLLDIVKESSQIELTAAETQLGMQLLFGQTLKNAAMLDNTAYETKRSQFKSLSSKLDVRGQTEVVRLLTTQVLQSLAKVLQPKITPNIDHYARNYLPPEVRRLSMSTPQGLQVPVLEYGPINGKPCIILHPMIFPPIGADEIDQANRLGLRLIWPLRPGLFDQSAPVMQVKQHLETSVSGLICVLERLVGRDAPVLALVSSGAVAARSAHMRPDLIQSICFAATCYSAGRSEPGSSYFGIDLAELARRSESVMTRTVAALGRHANNDKRFRSICETVFRGSQPDLAHLHAELYGTDAGARLRLAILGSPESIKQDFFNQTHFSWQELASLSLPIRFLHGAKDSIHPPNKLAKILHHLDGTHLNIVEGMGHLPHYADLRETIEFAFATTP